jgi:hypothetical protein
VLRNRFGRSPDFQQQKFILIFGAEIVFILLAALLCTGSLSDTAFYPFPARRLPPLRWEMNCVPYSLDFPSQPWYNIFSRILKKG